MSVSLAVCVCVCVYLKMAIKTSHKTLSAKRKSRFKTNAIKNEVMHSSCSRRGGGLVCCCEWELCLLQELPKVRKKTKFRTSTARKLCTTNEIKEEHGKKSGKNSKKNIKKIEYNILKVRIGSRIKYGRTKFKFKQRHRHTHTHPRSHTRSCRRLLSVWQGIYFHNATQHKEAINLS